jgi:hypothetical protein
MAASRTAWRVWNRTVNPTMRALLRSPARGLLSGSLAVITYTGRRSGREYTIVTGYRRTNQGIRVGVGWPETKVWWRNFSDAAGPVRVRVGDAEYVGTAVTEGDEQVGVHVDISLDGWADA